MSGNYDHIRVEFLEPHRWWQQGYDRPARGQYAVVNTSDKYTHPRYSPVPQSRVIEGPFTEFAHADAYRERIVDDAEFEDYALEVECSDRALDAGT